MGGLEEREPRNELRDSLSSTTSQRSRDPPQSTTLQRGRDHESTTSSQRSRDNNRITPSREFTTKRQPPRPQTPAASSNVHDDNRFPHFQNFKPIDPHSDPPILPPPPRRLTFQQHQDPSEIQRNIANERAHEQERIKKIEVEQRALQQALAEEEKRRKEIDRLNEIEKQKEIERQKQLERQVLLEKQRREQEFEELRQREIQK